MEIERETSRPLGRGSSTDPATRELLVDPVSYRDGAIKTCPILLKEHASLIKLRPKKVFQNVQIAPMIVSSKKIVPMIPLDVNPRHILFLGLSPRSEFVRAD